MYLFQFNYATDYATQRMKYWLIATAAAVGGGDDDYYYYYYKSDYYYMYLKRKETRTSHIFTQTTHIAQSTPNLSCGVESQTQSTMPSFVKIGSGFLAAWGVEICHFRMHS